MPQITTDRSGEPVWVCPVCGWQNPETEETCEGCGNQEDRSEDDDEDEPIEDIL